MKKIILSVAVLALVGAGVFGITRAYFSDTETSTGNTFTAGTIDIKVDGQNPWDKSYSIGDLKPGETDYITFNIRNVGQNPVNISKRVYNFVGDGGAENFDCSTINPNDPAWDYSASSEPECMAEAGNPNNNIYAKIYYDLSVEVWKGGNKIWWQTIETGDNRLVDVYSGGQYVELGMLPVGAKMIVTQSYHLDEDTNNKFQGDTATFSMEIKGEQMAQDDQGLTNVMLENKDGEPDWNIISGDNVEGVLSYKTKGEKFDYTFTGKVNTSGNYTLLYVGPTNDYPCVGSVVLGTGSFVAGSDVTISGEVITDDIINGKIWLIPSSSYSGGQMTSWPLTNILFETALINYDEI
jgi:predicted ribosomally synthesized peptide with SipW-like signal peptide